MQIQRYFGIDKTTNTDSFRPAESLIFITGCNAAELKAILDDRLMFHSTRKDLSDVIDQSTLFTPEELEVLNDESGG